MPNNSHFTPEQIQEILDLYFENFAHRQYIGARYVPIFGRKDETSIEWDNTGTYEPLTIVLYQGNSYTSRQFVPVGVEITNQTYWANTGNYNAQVEQYRQITQQVADELGQEIENRTAADNEIKAVLPVSDFSSENTVKDNIDAEESARKLDIEKAHVFDTVADMKANNNLSVGAICHTNGFYSSGDGGDAWYEITDSGIANEMDVIACDDLFAKLICSNEVNVCQLGCKLDGTADISAIVNAMTEKYILRFPAGKFLVENPLYIKQSIYGSGWDRLWNGSNTQFISTIETSSYQDTTVINIENTINGINSIEVKNINIKCNTKESGIWFKTLTNPININLFNISVWNCETVGILINPNNGDSRNILMENCSVWHKTTDPDSYPNSVGIYIGGNAYDSIVSNCYAMGFQCGFHIQSYSMLSNLHSWCGLRGITQTAWNGSKAFWIEYSVLANNLYADTAYYAIQQGEGTADVKNLYVYYDNTISSFTFNNLGLFAITADNGFIKINGGNLEDKHGFVNRICDSNLYSLTRQVDVQNFCIYTDINPENNAQIIPLNMYEPYRISGMDDNTKWYEVATIIFNSSASNSVAKLIIQPQNGTMSELTIAKKANSISVFNECFTSFGVPVKYLIDGNCVRLFVNNANVVSILPIFQNMQVKIMNYAYIRNFTNKTEKTRQILDSDSTLTAGTTVYKDA